ncbi:MAG: tetratricopeptide (TPR) repeat protein [Parvicella sp.]|jgi:tetratricopeptide (TPR) repeat protein
MKNLVCGFLLALLCGTNFWSAPATANSMQVIGAGSIAQECYRLSAASTMTGHASGADIKVCNKAIRHGKLTKRDLIATHVNRGIIYVALENYQMAAKDYNRAIDLSDNVSEAYVNRGNLRFIAKRHQEAIADYDKALEQEFAQAHIAHLNRGMAYETLGKLVQAKDNYLAALELIDGWSEAQSRLDRVSKKLLKVENK